MKKVIIAALVVLCFTSCKTKPNNENRISSNLSNINNIDDDWIRKVIDSTVKTNNIPGLAVGILKNGKLKFEGYGTTERDVNKKIDENSIFQIGSDTKKITAIIVRNLVAQGKLDLNTPIIDYLSNSITNETKVKLKNITLKILLLHRSGIPNRAPSNKRIDGDPMLISYTEKDLITDLNNIKLDFEPNSEMSYSNLGYAIIGYICETVSQKEYSELLKSYISEKYGMENTFIYPNKTQLLSITTPYRKDDRSIKSQPWKMGKITPAGGIYSNVYDISKLMNAQIEAYNEFNKTSNNSNPLLLTESDDIQGSHYGFGLSKNVEENWTRFGHGGDLDGYGSGYVFSPEKNVGLIMLTTSGGRWFGELENKIKTYLFK